MPSPLLRPRLYWTLQLVGWSLYGLFGGILASIFGRFSPTIAAVEVVVTLTLLGLSHALRLYVRRQGWARLPLGALWPRLLLAHLGVAVVSQVIIGALVVALLWATGQLDPSKGFPWLQYVGYGLNVFFVMWLWSALYFGLHYLAGYRQAEVDKWQLEAAAREAEMHALLGQLNPHFLFNGLNNIRALVLENPARARDMMTHLAELLRYALQLNRLDRVPLARELAVVRDYLALETLQLEDRLRCAFDVEPAALDALLPPMTVQLLVENALKHGIAPRPGGGTLRLRAALEADTLCLTVRNPGRFRPTATPAAANPGVGLRNTRERLQLLFGPAANLHVADDPAEPDTVRAELRLPVTRVSDPQPAAISEASAS